MREDDATGGTGTATAALVRFRAGTLVPESRATFPRARRATWETRRRSARLLLRALGVVVQLRAFVFVTPVREEQRFRKRRRESATARPRDFLPPPGRRDHLDDDRATGARRCSAARRPPAAASASPSETARAARRRRTSGTPSREDAEDAPRWRRARRRAEMLRDAPRWVTETACALAGAARGCGHLGADVRRDCALEMASQPRLAAGGGGPGGAPAVTESLIDAVRASVRGSVSFGLPVQTRGWLRARPRRPRRRAAPPSSARWKTRRRAGRPGGPGRGRAGRRGAPARRGAEALTRMRDLEREIRDRGGGTRTRAAWRRGTCWRTPAGADRQRWRPATKNDVEARWPSPRRSARGGGGGRRRRGSPDDRSTGGCRSREGRRPFIERS